jgi:hypothetical protein
MPRPYRIPLGNVTLVIAWIIPLLFCAFTAITPLLDGCIIAGATAGFIIFGLGLHPTIQAIKRHCERERKRTKSVVTSRIP